MRVCFALSSVIDDQKLNILLWFRRNWRQFDKFDATDRFEAIVTK